MLESLQNHPFPVEAFFKSSVVLTYAVPKEQLEHFIPECLSLDTFEDKWAFIAVAMVETSGLRPKGFPKILGNDFFLTGYRIFVRYTNSSGKRLRGLYILQSETDKSKMVFFGNLFTHYHYRKIDITKHKTNLLTGYSSEKSNFKVTFQQNNEVANLPDKSPFNNWKEARRYAGPLPFTFTYNEGKNEVLIIEGVREKWKPEPIEVTEHHFSFINKMNLNDCVLANAFKIDAIPYVWKKGKTDLWKPLENLIRE
ncbi:DUF2071 domain-containing protein [Flavobacterium amniphilum]|uniref:DUF2071 domain-containing protein n=1 Tax=Flavobacterium amniphilum TaxID=1834035 RepID=UPI00202A3B79|nr:DUF2071 domain-containing protein [Flavobacterium amniphilum]MCL9805219.1 DUF2071 domain-containing protein [Flavobacterium amniphilum]